MLDSNKPRLLALVILPLIFHSVSSLCEVKDHQVVCDTLQDIHSAETDEWTNLVVGNGKVPNEHPFHRLDDAFCGRFRHLHAVTIINQIRGLSLFETYSWLDSITLYENNINYLNLTYLDSFPDLRKLELKRNRIQGFDGVASGRRLKIVDLSENKIEVLHARPFGNSTVRWLSLRRNKIGGVEPGAVPTSVEVLNLDHNKLSSFEEEMFRDDNHLEELTMSHNSLILIPKITKRLARVRFLDFSYNQISVLRPAFYELEDLRYLDLSHNRIKSIERNFRNGNNLYRNLKLALGFNRLSTLDYYAVIDFFGYSQKVVENVNNTLSLYGNPICCECLDQIKIYLYQQSISRTSCDQEFSFTGKAPSCLTGRPKSLAEYVAVDENDLENFLKHYELSKKIVKCDLRRDFYEEANIILRRKFDGE